VAGHYRYVREGRIMSSRFADLYIKACDLSFDTYSRSLPVLQKYLEEREPIDKFSFFDSGSKTEKPFGQLKAQSDIEAAKRIYRVTVRAKALDLLRGLLPASAMTNVGITGNGRAFEYLLTIMYGSRLEELRSLAGQLFDELNSVIPSFVRRANDRYGQALQQYMSKTENEVRDLVRRHLSGMQVEACPAQVRLVEHGDNTAAEVRVASAILYEQAQGRTLDMIMKHVRSMPEGDRHQIIRSYTKHRENRRHRPGRAYEMVDYTFELFTNFGMFRDLHRHRVLTMERQLLSTRHGYDMPAEIDDAGIGKGFADCMDFSRQAYEAISQEMPEEAQYAVNFAYRYPYFIKMNLREACHMVELRTAPQGHPDYRKVCQEMFSQIRQVHPVLAEGIKFADMNSYELERLGSEKRTERKRQSGA
jgi:thymidylate synthase ThyX